MVDIDYDQIKHEGCLKRSKDIPYFYINEEYNENCYTRLESLWYDDEKDVIGIKIEIISPFKTIENEFEVKINSFGLTLNDYMAILKPDNLMYAYDVESLDVWFEVKDQKLLEILKSGNNILRFTTKFNVEVSTINEKD